MKSIIDYKVIIFDCDGVILNSNHIKSEAFAETVRFLGDEAASAFKRYHIQHGGISRYQKFDYFIDTIMPNLGLTERVNKEMLLKEYASRVIDALLSCEIDKSLHKLKSVTSNAAWAVASGSDELELRYVFNARQLDSLFELGIWGSPKTKQEILDIHFTLYDPKDMLFIGDSLYDYKVSHQFGLDFVFLSHWSEFDDITVFSDHHQVPIYSSLEDLY